MFVFERLSHRVQLTLLISLTLHAAVVSMFGIRRFSRPTHGVLLTDVMYMDENEFIGDPDKPRTPTRPKPVPKEVVDTESTSPAEAQLEKEVEQAQEQGAGLPYDPDEVQRRLFLPFYAVEEVPTFQSKIMPVYPESAQKLGRVSKVILEAYIDPDGAVRMIRVVKSGGELFDQAAIAALKKSRFSPARINGKAVPVKLLVPYVFTLEQ